MPDIKIGITESGEANPCTVNYAPFASAPQEHDKIISLLKRIRPFIERAGQEAEALHDDMGGDYYMDSAQFEIMRETGEILKEIDTVLK